MSSTLTRTSSSSAGAVWYRDGPRKVLRDIGRCRTAALGTHPEQCDRCNYETVAYDSCRNRHCPKCQSSPRDRWLMKPGLKPAAVAYCPCGLHRARSTGAARTPQPASVLQPAVSGRLGDPAGDRRRSTPSRRTHRRARCAAHLVAEPETSSAPALSRSRRRTGLRSLPLGRHQADGFFLPVRVLSRMFRGKLLAFLKQSYRRSELCFSGSSGCTLRTTRISLPAPYACAGESGWSTPKPPFGGPEHVLKYLARYTHRVAISNGRLLRSR